MEKVPKIDQTPLSEPTESQITDYFRRLGMRFRPEFRILKQDEFRVSGNRAKKEGWFIGYRGIVEAALSLKVAELLHLSDEEKRLLAEASLVNAAMRRVQYERRGSALSSEERDAIDEEGSRVLIDNGADPRAIEIGKAGGARFTIEAARMEGTNRSAEEQRIFDLSKYFAYIHNCVDIQMSTSESGVKTQKTDIVDWKKHLDEAEVRYPGMAAERETVRGQVMGNFDIQKMMMREIESELERRIRELHPDASSKYDEPLWKLLRNEIRHDIAKGTLPQMPR